MTLTESLKTRPIRFLEVWDFRVLSHERDAWGKAVLGSRDGSDLEQYFSIVLNENAQDRFIPEPIVLCGSRFSFDPTSSLQQSCSLFARAPTCCGKQALRSFCETKLMTLKRNGYHAG